MRRHTEIVASYWCRHCKREFIKTFRKRPWFDDYSANCKCGRQGIYKGNRDFSHDVMNDSERRWDKR